MKYLRGELYKVFFYLIKKQEIKQEKTGQEQIPLKLIIEVHFYRLVSDPFCLLSVSVFLKMTDSLQLF